jgi:hypothetical protein
MRNLSSIASAVNNLGAARSMQGTLRIFGEWFGSPREDPTQITSASIDQHQVVLNTNKPVRILVWDPEDWTISENAFEIRRASRVRFEAIPRQDIPSFRPAFFVDCRVVGGSVITETSLPRQLQESMGVHYSAVLLQ